jgi:hypothetical protein
MDLSAGTLMTSLCVSTIGFGLFRYGKQAERIPQLAAGIVMMIYPYFLASATWSLCLAGAIVGGLWLAVRAGL